MASKDRLSGVQVEMAATAILDGYRREAALREMVRVELDENLDEIAGGATLKAKVLDLIEWGESTGRAAAVIAAAYNHNPGNPQLLALVREAPAWPACADAGLVVLDGRASHYVLRSVELEYLDKLLERLRDWAERYTPLAGMLESRLSPLPEAGDDLPDFLLHPALERLAELNAAHVERAEPQPVPDLRSAMVTHPRLVVLGEPGAGKTTTLWRLVFDSARQAKEDPNAPLPLLAPLGRYIDPVPVQAYLAQVAGNVHPGMQRHLPAYLHAGRMLLLLDGLNEMPAQDYGGRVADLEALFGRFRKAPAVVTCRTLDYKDEPKLEKLRIRPLDMNRQRAYLHRYLGEHAGDGLFWQLAGADVADLWQTWAAAGGAWEDFCFAEKMPAVVYGRTSGHQDRVWERLRSGVLPPLLALGANPLMLFMLVRTYRSEKGVIPQNRGRLFADFVDSLLAGERKRCGEDRWPGAEVLLAGLAEMAYAMQHAGERGTAVPWQWAMEKLANFGCAPEQMLHLCAGATLLDVSGEQVRFFHQLIQEYFAALAWQQRFGDGEALDRYWPKGWLALSGWEETAILLAGILPTMQEFVTALRPVHPALAARCIVESGGVRPDAATVQGVQQRLLAIATGLDAAVQERNAAGNALIFLGDARVGVGIRQGVPEIDWCAVPAGEFLMGSVKEVDGLARDEEMPQHPLWLPEFAISRYPITNAQYQVFIDDGGYTERWKSCWTEAGWQWRVRRDLTGPVRYGADYDLPNHPVVGVTWYEAVAFCNWLGARSGQVVRLPSEAEWEKAARGMDGRIYPWGSDLTTEHANYSETHIGVTSAAGVFPRGASPYGLLDMAGNVWEWTGSLYRPYPYDSTDGREDSHSDEPRALRGGSFDYNAVRVRCAARFRYLPDFRLDNFGFRVVSPGS